MITATTQWPFYSFWMFKTGLNVAYMDNIGYIATIESSIDSTIESLVLIAQYYYSGLVVYRL